MSYIYIYIYEQQTRDLPVFVAAVLLYLILIICVRVSGIIATKERAIGKLNSLPTKFTYYGYR